MRSQVKRSGVLAMLAAAAFWAPLGLVAQEAAPSAGAKPAFEVASIKRNRSGEPFMRFGGPPGKFMMTNVPLRQIILQAYQIQPLQLVGGPDWMAEERWDIVASTGGPLPSPAPFAGERGPNTLMLMLRSLLEDRFKLRMHAETREMPVYALVPARSDRQLGPQLKPTAVDCAAMFARGRGDGAPAPPPQPGARPPCSFMMSPGSFAASSVPMSELARVLSPRAGRIVIDKTGLTGLYDFDLTFTPDQLPQGPAPAAPPGAPPLPPIDPNGPSLFTALQEQLGLKLESARAPVDVLVIDSVERPTED